MIVKGVISVKRKTTLRNILMGTAAITTAGPFAAPAVAQSNQLDEIVVTATLREKSVQDIPITVTVLGADLIARADINDAAGIAINTPGLTLGEFAPGQPILTMRGVGSADDGAGLDNSVAAFLDGVYIGRGAGVNFDVFDLERIEVLKGPQGALFGRNTIGGAISVVTSRPNLEEFEGKASVTGGNEGIFRAQGLITGPISENVAGKLVVNHRQHDGFVRNTLLQRDVNDEDTVSVRGQILADLGNTEWLISADYLSDDRLSGGRFPFVSPFAAVAESLGANRPQTNASPIIGFSDREQKGVSIQGDIQLGSGTLISISAYRNVETDWEMPSVGAPLGGTDLANGVFGRDVTDDIDEEVTTYSQELRYVSDNDGPLNYVAGLFFFQEETDRVEQFHMTTNSIAGGQVNIGTEYTRTENETTSYAAYGQATYDFSEDWTLLVGGRFTRDEKDYVATAVDCGQSEADRAAAGFANFPGCQDAGGSLSIVSETFRAPANASFNDFSPMASIQYRPTDNAMLFATFSTGFKSGGFAGSQGVESAATAPVNPENANNFELGFKSELMDRRLRLNATAFYTDYSDLQIVRFGPVPNSAFGTFITANIGSADIYGIEVDFNFLVTDNFTLAGNYAFLESEANDLIIENRMGIEIDVSGVTLRQSPKHSLNLIADYFVPLGDMGDLNFNAQYSYTSEQRFDYLNDDTIAEKISLIDARIDWTTPSGKYKISLWGKNLADYNYVKHSYVIGPGTIGLWGNPRTYGVTATVSF